MMWFYWGRGLRWLGGLAWVALIVGFLHKKGLLLPVLMAIFTMFVGNMLVSTLAPSGVTFETLESLFALQFLCAVAGACICIKKGSIFTGIIFFILCMSI